MENATSLSQLEMILSHGTKFHNLTEPCESIRTNWVVLTGAPGSGKTSISRYLENNGFTIVHEMSRIVIEDALDKGFSIQEIMKDPELLTSSILARNYDRATFLSPEKQLVWDTGLLDSAAFYGVAGIEFQNRIGFLNAFRYKSVIFLEMLPQELLSFDNVRPQDVILRKKIDSALRNIYTQFGYYLTVVPVSGPESRAIQVVNLMKLHL